MEALKKPLCRFARWKQVCYQRCRWSVPKKGHGVCFLIEEEVQGEEEPPKADEPQNHVPWQYES